MDEEYDKRKQQYDPEETLEGEDGFDEIDLDD